MGMWLKCLEMVTASKTSWIQTKQCSQINLFISIINLLLPLIDFKTKRVSFPTVAPNLFSSQIRHSSKKSIFPSHESPGIDPQCPVLGSHPEPWAHPWGWEDAVLWLASLDHMTFRGGEVRFLQRNAEE